MANALFCYPDNVQPTTYQTPTLSNGSWEVTLPIENIQDTALASMARSTDDLNASTIVDIDLIIGRPVRVVTIIKHNLSQAAKFRVTASTVSDFATSSYQSAWVDVWPQFYDLGELPWGYPGLWTGVLASEETDGYTMQAIHVLPSDEWARYWRVEIDDESNPDGYVEFARLGLWSVWQPTINIEQGAKAGWTTDTPVARSLSGVDYFDKRNPRRVANFTIERIAEDTAMKKPFEMFRKLGKDGQLFFVFNPDDAQDDLFRRSFLATLRELSPLEYPVYGYNKQAFSLQEVL